MLIHACCKTMEFIMKKIKYILISLLTLMVTSSVSFSSEILKLPATVVGNNYGFTEGPVWVGNKNLWLFTDIPMNKIYSLDANGNISVWMEDSGYANGLNIDKNNNIWIAHHCRKVSYTTPNGKNNVVASNYNGKKLNSPNDIAVRKDGSVWFTDPMYGITFKGFGCELAKEEQPVRGVYQIKDGEVTLKTGSIEIPNGIAFSNDEQFLYVANSADGVVYRFEVHGDKLTNKRPWVKIESGKRPHPTFGYIADGLQVDKNGNLYVSGGHEGFAIFSPEGKQLQLIQPDAGKSESPMAGFVSNIAIGGSNNKQLMVTVGNQLLIYDIK